MKIGDRMRKSAPKNFISSENPNRVSNARKQKSIPRPMRIGRMNAAGCSPTMPMPVRKRRSKALGGPVSG